MSRKWLALLLAMLLLVQGAALAEAEFSAAVAAGRTFAVYAAYGGKVSQLLAAQGDVLEADGALLKLSGEKIYAPVDGTASAVYVAEGDDAAAATQRYGAAVVIEPQEKFTVYMTAEKEYRADATKHISVGETLYLKCKTDGSHKGVGAVTEVDGFTYTIECTGGEFSNGEVVYAGRKSGFSKNQRVGIGTVLAAEAKSVSAEGVVTAAYVSAGDAVQAGQLLMETATGSLTGEEWNGGIAAAPQQGIVLQMNVRQGDTVRQGQVLAVLADPADLCVEMTVNEADLMLMQAGSTVEIWPEDGAPMTGVVGFVSYIADAEGMFAVRIDPAQRLTDAVIGQCMTVIPKGIGE